MKVLLSAALVLAALTTSALAEPAKATKPPAQSAHKAEPVNKASNLVGPVKSSPAAAKTQGPVKLNKEQMGKIRGAGGGLWGNNTGPWSG